MKALLVGLALLVAVPASAIDNAQGSGIVQTCPTANCALSGSGPVVTMDGQSVNDVTWHYYGNGEGSAPALGGCVVTGRFRIIQNGVYLVNDEAASISITRENSCPVGVVISGNSAGPFTVTFTNPHIDSFGRLAFDIAFQRQSGGGGGGGGDDPPIERM